jgi:cell division protein FtsB
VRGDTFFRPATRRHLTPRRFAQASLVLLALGLVGAFVFSEYGLRNLLSLQKKETALEGQITALESRHAALVEERAALTKDAAAIERVAREKYLLAKPGEVTYVFVPVDSAGAPLPPARRTPADASGPGAADFPLDASRPRN